jgi:hypothetical protein
MLSLFCSLLYIFDFLMTAGPSGPDLIQSGYNTGCVGFVAVWISGDRLWCFFFIFLYLFFFISHGF